MEYVWFALIGLAAGFLAGLIMKGKSFDLLTNLIVGVVGALLGGFLCGVLGISAGGLLGSLVVATLGAVLFLYLLQVIKTRM